MKWQYTQDEIAFDGRQVQNLEWYGERHWELVSLFKIGEGENSRLLATFKRPDTGEYGDENQE